MSADAKLLYVIPGFRHTVIKDMPTKFVRYLSQKEAASVTVVVLWTEAAGWYNANFNHAAISTWPIGNVVAYVNNELYINGLETRTYCIGHSFGAHICGFFGKRATSLRSSFVIQKIIGIDPAGPIFEDTTHVARLRLATGDAREVEVLHTNTKILGIKKPIGDVDFYINGGAKQPYCQGLGLAEYCYGQCSHRRGYYLLMLYMKRDENCYGIWGCTNSEHVVDAMAQIHSRDERAKLKISSQLQAVGCTEYQDDDIRRIQLGTLTRDSLGGQTGMIYWVQADTDSKSCPFWIEGDIH